jgi:hypothetical protein
MLRDLIALLLAPPANIVSQGQEHFLAFYQNAVEEIRFLKTQQWKIANYALLLYAAIIVISSQYIKPPLSTGDCILLIFLALFIATCAIRVLVRLESSIQTARSQYEEASKRFPPEARKMADEFQKRSPKRSDIMILLVIVVCVSALITVWLIVRTHLIFSALYSRFSGS